MPIDEVFVIDLSKKFDFLEKRMTYLEEKCTGQQIMIEKLQKKLRNDEESTEIQDQLIEIKNHEVSEDPVDLKPDVDSNGIRIVRVETIKSNENLKVNVERRPQRDRKLSQKLIVQMGENEKRYSCTFCPKSFSRAQTRNDHLRTHTGERPYSCSICSKTFSKYSSLRYHKKLQNTTGCIAKGGSKKVHKCSICSKVFLNSSLLSIHLRTHTGEKPYKCNSCTKSFTQIQSLKTHQNLHTGEKPYSCSICSKSFPFESGLWIHSRIHAGKTSSCTVCSKSFADMSNLKRHMRIHTGEKPYSCSKCSKKYSQPTHLKRHMSSQH